MVDGVDGVDGDLSAESFHYCTGRTVSHAMIILGTDAIVCSVHYAVTTISISIPNSIPQREVEDGEE